MHTVINTFMVSPSYELLIVQPRSVGFTNKTSSNQSQALSTSVWGTLPGSPQLDPALVYGYRFLKVVCPGPFSNHKCRWVSFRGFQDTSEDGPKAGTILEIAELSLF